MAKPARFDLYPHVRGGQCRHVEHVDRHRLVDLVQNCCMKLHSISKMKIIGHRGHRERQEDRSRSDNQHGWADIRELSIDIKPQHLVVDFLCVLCDLCGYRFSLLSMSRSSILGWKERPSS